MAMTFSTYAATALVPTLSRLVLCAAFIVAGGNKLFKTAEFTGDDARRLVELGVTPATPAAAPGARPVAFVQEAPPPAPSQTRRPSPETGSLRDGLPQPPEDAIEAPNTSEPGADSSSTPIVTGPVSARALHHVTLLLDRAGLPEYQPHLAWTAALTEFIGGALLLIGLFSRIWGLGLALAMGVAFYLVSLPAIVQTPNPFTFGENIMAFSTLFNQLGLFVLAFGVFVTGPGPLSLDRALFGGVDADDEADGGSSPS
jgi:uncharacterized membrane protein YphA (DoxX/SURF4 family)